MNVINKEIRDLLSRWYDAETTRAEEARLEELLRSARDLPADLEKDKKLFLSLSSLAEVNEASEGRDAKDSRVSAFADIPDDLSAMISEALEAEIAKSSLQDEKAAKQPNRSVWFRRLGATAGIAAALIGGVLLLRPLFNAPVQSSLTAENLGSATNAESIAAVDSNAFVGTSLRDVDPGAESVNSGTTAGASKTHIARTKHRKARTRGISENPAVSPDDTSEDFGYLSEEEEARLMAGHYRVVSDEREAYAMVNTVFSRLEGHMIQEDYRLDGISAQYESEISNLYN